MMIEQLWSFLCQFFSKYLFYLHPDMHIRFFFLDPPFFLVKVGGDLIKLAELNEWDNFITDFEEVSESNHVLLKLG